jgi:voltage-gated potassium channel
MERIKAVYLLIAFFIVLVVGTLGYQLLEGWNFIDSLFMTVITITTVGFREVGGPLSTSGKIFTIFLIFSGFGVAALALSHLTSLIIKGELNQIWGKLRMDHEIKKLSGHYIIAGFGRTGHVIAQHLIEKKTPFVVIDINEAVLFKLKEIGILGVYGDAAEEETLKKAGIEKAKGLVTVVSNDAANAFSIMSALELNPKLTVIARALDSQNIRKLKIAGAHRVIAPYELGGLRIAQAVTHPHVADFIDVVEDVRAKHIEIADVLITKGSRLAGQVLNSDLMRSANVIVVGIRRSGDTTDFEFHPKATTQIKANDHMIIMGPSDAIEKVHEFAMA